MTRGLYARTQSAVPISASHAICDTTDDNADIMPQSCMIRE